MPTRRDSDHLLRIIYCILLLSPLARPLLGQGPKSFGQVSVEELEMEVYEADQSAPAVWLQDVGKVYFDASSSEDHFFYRHRRLKVVDSDGLGLTNLNLAFDFREEKLIGIKAASYKLNPEGEVIQFKLTNRQLKVHKLDKYRREVRIDFPLVEVGSVVEVEYIMRRAQYRLIGPWKIKESLPVALSYFQANLPNNLEYQPIIAGAFSELKQYREPFQIRESSRSSDGNTIYNNALDARAPTNLQRGMSTIFVVENVPADIENSYLSDSEVLQSGITLQFVRDLRQGSAQNREFSSWENVYRYGQKRLKPRKLRLPKLEMPRELKRKLRGLDTEQAKARYIYQYLQNEVSWDGTYATWPGNLERVWRRKEGSSGALNMLLLHMLREAGIEADPVLISTLDHGIVIIRNPGFSYFNHLIVNVPQGVDPWLVDLVGTNATSEVLPKEDLNQIGLAFGKEKPYWVPLRAQNKMIRFTYGRFQLQNSGLMKGEIIIENEAQRAQIDREKLANWPGNSQSFWKEYILTGLRSYELLSTEIENEGNINQPLIFEAAVTTPDFAERAGDLLFLRPMLIKQIQENPFKQTSRSAPVDLSYPLRESYLIGVNLPEGFVVEQLPQPVRVVLPNGGGTFVYNVTTLGNILHISSTIYLDQTLFMPEEYQAIKDFFQYVVQKHQESVVLRQTKID